MGSITAIPVDSWNSNNYGMPSAIYYYILSRDITDFNENSMDILGNCPAIQSIQYVPFLNVNDLDLYKIPYDTERFGSIDKLRPTLEIIPDVYRIGTSLYDSNQIGEFTKYKVQKSIGGQANWRNESRLYNYPYSFAMITDHLNTPMEIKYHLIEDGAPSAKVFVKSTISDRCSYGLYVQFYKGDPLGKMEALVSGDSHELPCSSSAYNQWFASSKNQNAQRIRDVASNSFLTKETTSRMVLPNTIGQLSSINLNPASMVGTGADMYGQFVSRQQSNKRADLDVQQSIQNQIAQTSDVLSTPNTMLSMGSDVYYGLANGYKKVTLYRYSLENEQLEKLGNYFAMFGYKQNKVMTPKTRDRYYYNYIKTVGCNIEGYNIPRNHLDELKNIFDKGVTIWHYDRENVRVGNYTMDNYEV